ncbi:hypothetical protein ABIC94_003749 [Variovorax paradoxus]
MLQDEAVLTLGPPLAHKSTSAAWGNLAPQKYVQPMHWRQPRSKRQFEVDGYTSLILKFACHELHVGLRECADTANVRFWPKSACHRAPSAHASAISSRTEQ